MHGLVFSPTWFFTHYTKNFFTSFNIWTQYNILFLIKVFYFPIPICPSNEKALQAGFSSGGGGGGGLVHVPLPRIFQVSICTNNVSKLVLIYSENPSGINSGFPQISALIVTDFDGLFLYYGVILSNAKYGVHILTLINFVCSIPRTRICWQSF